MSKAVLKNQISGEVVSVTSAKGKTRNGKVFDVWIDANKKPLCIIGNELPSWKPVMLNNHPVLDRDALKPEIPIGTLSR